MKIEQLDKNFAIVNQDNGEEKAVYTLPHLQTMQTLTS